MILLPTLFLGGLGWVFFASVRRKQELELLPSLVWAGLMAIPFLLQKNMFDPLAVDRQAFGIGLVGLALLVGDSLGVFSKRSASFAPRRYGPARELRLLAALVVVLPLVHLCLMPQIPLIEKWLNPSLDPQQLAAMREASSKLLRVNRWFIYGCQFCLIIAPVSTFLLWRAGQRLIAGALLVFFLFYSRATLAKGPLVTGLAIGGLLFVVVVRPRFPRWGTRLLAGAAAFSLLLAAFFSFWSENGLANCHKLVETNGWANNFSLNGKNGNPALTAMDYCRIVGNQPSYESRIGFFQERLNSVLYRVVLVPSEVASRWYAYYPLIHGSALGVSGLTSSSRNSPDFRHPANVIGQWAYASRFPKNYGPTVSAYASVDADAAARFGVVGLVGAALLLLGLRLLTVWLRGSDDFSIAIYWALLAALALGLPNASLQAILVAHGVAGLFVVLALLRPVLQYAESSVGAADVISRVSGTKHANR